MRYSLRRQLRWRSSLVKTLITDERTYYSDLLKFARSKMMVVTRMRRSIMLTKFSSSRTISRTSSSRECTSHRSSIISRSWRTSCRAVCLPTGTIMSHECTEKSYDSLPNFSAADSIFLLLTCFASTHILGVRLLGIGRNQFIDIMNKSRTKGWLPFGAKTSVVLKKGLLPTRPVPIDMEHWWLVQIGYVTEDDIRVRA